MTQSRSGRLCKLGIASLLATVGVFADFGDCALAQIKPDNSLGAESSVVTSKVINGYPSDQIDGGAIRGANLFHSFEKFSVITGHTAYFNNAPNIQNIISRVTGGSVSNIDGLIRANGTANLFLLNPNGIIFSPNASLDIRGSFMASTASSLNFADGSQFITKAPQSTPLLTVSVPLGLQFGRGNPGSIINQSQATDSSGVNVVGLQVKPGKTLALVGGDVLLEGGNLTAAGGRIELGSVAGNSLVTLNPTKKGWALSYESAQDFQNIQLTPRTFDGSEILSFVDASGKGGGDIQVQGRFVRLTGGSGISAITTGTQPGGNLTVTASELVELIGPGTPLSTQTSGTGVAGSITINTRNLILSNGVQVLTSTSGKGSGGQLTVNASDEVELNGTSPDFGPNILTTATAGAGAAGNLTINTGRLLIQDGATISTAAQYRRVNGKNVPATGPGGDLTVNASNSVELIDGSLSTEAVGSGKAGDLTINTGRLLIQDGAQVAVSSKGTGAAGNLKVISPSILLDNGTLSAETKAGQGNINLASQNLVLRRGSNITTNATDTATGGNITIKTGVLTALENSDIRANADKGPGGRVIINAQGIFGTSFRQQDTPLSDITASSTLGPQFSGTVQINTLGINPNFGLVNLPVRLVDVPGLIAEGCPTDVGPRGSKFVVTGRGGLPPTPREALRSEPTLVDLGTTVPGQKNRASAATAATNLSNSESAPIVEATGWVTNAKGEVMLVANPPTFTPDIPWMAPTSCHTQ